MDKNIAKPVAIIVGAYILISLLSLIFKENDFIITLNIVFMIIWLIIFPIGIILLFIKHSKDTGKIIVISTLLMIIVGFSVCSLQ